MRRLLSIAFLGLSFVAASLSAQVNEPRAVDMPLVSEQEQTREDLASQFLWKKEAADNALRSGLSGIAIGLYDRLLEEADEDLPITHAIELSRVSAYISLGRMEEADQALREYRGAVNAPYALRRAWVSFFSGESESAENTLEALSEEALSMIDLPWYYLLAGLLDIEPEGDEAPFLDRAREAAISVHARAQMDLIIYRSALLNSDDLDERDLERLQDNMESEIASGSRIGFQFAKEYAVALSSLDDLDAAIRAIDDALLQVTEADFDLRDELWLLKGVISSADASVSRQAFRSLLRDGVSTDLRLSALQQLASAAFSATDISDFLDFTEQLDKDTLPTPLVNEVLFHRAQLLYRIREFEGSEAECRALLENDPGLELRESSLRLLVLIAFQRQRYRMASGLLIDLSELLEDPEERNRIQLLVADCFFQAGDYNNAAESYALAVEIEGADRGTVLFQWIQSEINNGELEKARMHINAYKNDESIDAMINGFIIDAQVVVLVARSRVLLEVVVLEVERHLGDDELAIHETHRKREAVA